MADISTRRCFNLACPFFVPTGKLENGQWLHPSRLPLGAGWFGRCSAPGHEGVEPSEPELHECNLGYARCVRLPPARSWDAVRFSVSRDRGSLIALWFVCEAAHHPVAHGVLEYSLTARDWTAAHADPRIQRLADCYLQSYLLRRIPPAAAGVAPSSDT